MQSVKMTLVAQILSRGQLYVNTLSLENDTDVASQFAGIFRDVISQNYRTAADWNHQRRQDSEHCGLTAAVGPSRPNNSAERTSKDTPSRAV